MSLLFIIGLTQLSRFNFSFEIIQWLTRTFENWILNIQFASQTEYDEYCCRLEFDAIRFHVIWVARRGATMHDNGWLGCGKLCSRDIEEDRVRKLNHTAENHFGVNLSISIGWFLKFRRVRERFWKYIHLLMDLYRIPYLLESLRVKTSMCIYLLKNLMNIDRHRIES